MTNISVSQNKKLRKIFGSSIRKNRSVFIFATTTEEQQKKDFIYMGINFFLSFLFLISTVFLPEQILLLPIYSFMLVAPLILVGIFAIKGMTAIGIKRLSIKNFLKQTTPSYSYQTKQINKQTIQVSLLKHYYQEPPLQLMENYINSKASKKYRTIIENKTFTVEQESDMWEYIAKLKLKIEQLNTEAEDKLYRQTSQAYQEIEKDYQTKLLLEATK